MKMRYKALRYLEATKFFLYTSLFGKFPSYSLRRLYLTKILGIRLGKKSAIHYGILFMGKHVVIGNNCVINRRCVIDGRVGIMIGNCVSISSEVMILSLTHDIHDELFKTIAKPVNISNYVWVGARAILLPGVTLGEGCVVGAGSVVTRNVNPFEVVAGIPAKVIGTRSKLLKYSDLQYFPLLDTDILP